MRKLTIILVAVLLIGTIFSAGCTSNQMPKDNNQIPDSVFNSTNNTTHNATKAVATVNPTATPAVPTAYPTPMPTYTPTSVPPVTTPTPLAPTPTPVTCTHVDISVYHPLNMPCMMCTERNMMLGSYAQPHSPYVAVAFVAVDNSTMGADTVRMSATVRETGASMSWDASHSESEVMAWSDAHLTCK